MTIRIDQVALPARDAERSARCVAEILGVAVTRDGNDPEDPRNLLKSDPLGGRGRVYFTDPEGHLFEVCA